VLENCVRRYTSLGPASLGSGDRMVRSCSPVHNDLDWVRCRARQEAQGDSEVPRRSTPTRATLALMALVLVLVPGVSGLDQARAQEATQGAPKLQTKSWALTDADTGLYLAGDNPDERLPVASTTNVMTALVALEEGVDLDEEVTVSKEAERFVGFTFSNVGLIAGERLSVRDLLVATLVPSGTEAVYALAEHLGDGSVERFVQKMNAKASEMGLKNTHFEDPAGLDAEGHYSSARDLAAITRAAMGYPAFAEIVGMQEATIETQDREIEVFNTNELLFTYPEATGVKTGTSPEAGPSLIASAKEGEEAYIAVVLDAESEDYRFEGAQVALGYGFESFDRRPLVREGKVYEESPLPYRRGESVGLAAEEDVLGLAGPDLETERRITENEPPPAARAGQQLGTVELLVDGQSIGSTPLVTQRGYEEASLWQKIKYWVGGLVGRVSG
jgi:D-alanyl-D-alanine carboxypeptidase (penicillin-binding protein 5/6)